MKRILGILFCLFTFLSSASYSFAATQTVVQIGDSLTSGMYRDGALVDKYKAAGWTAIIPGNPGDTSGGGCGGYIAGYPCHGVSGGTSPSGIEAVDINKDAIKSATAIVIEMGTNPTEGGSFKDAVSQMIDKIRAINPTAKIYWVNLVARTNETEYSSRNQAIYDVAASKNVNIIDWFHEVFPKGDPKSFDHNITGNENWFQPDGIHYTGEGYQNMSGLVVAKVNSGGSSGTNPAGGTKAAATACFITTVGKPSTPLPTYPPECVQSYVNGDALSCQYYGRGGPETIGNPEMGKTVIDVANKVGLPSTVMLAVMRIETSSAFVSTDPTYFANDYDANRSSANAIGIMQFLPPTFIGVFKNYTLTGEMESKFGKTSVQADVVPQVIPPPHDSVFRITSIKDSITAAAFYLRELKNSGVGSAAPWDKAAIDAAIDGYHGACPYPGGSGNYCDDVWQSVQACTATTTNPTSHPVAPVIADNNYKQALKDKFSLILDDGLSIDQQRWIWEKMWDVSNTNFDEYVKGTTIHNSAGVSHQGPGKEVTLRTTNTDETSFKIVFTHEMGHIIYHHTTDQQSKRSEHDGVLYPKGPVTGYGACDVTENYAEMIAYYLNPNQVENTNTPCGAWTPKIPYANGNNQNYFNLAKEILGVY